MESRKRFDHWVNSGYFDKDTKNELMEIAGNDKDINERFYKDLEFGTGGLRGIIGAGTNRINIYTVRKASQGTADFLKASVADAASKGVVIAHDSRRMSGIFAKEAACVFAANGIKTYLFDGLRSTPQLSYTVRHKKAAGGVVITASHNPKEYNGFKVYGEDGGQLPPALSDKVQEMVNSIADITSVCSMPYEEACNKGFVLMLGPSDDDSYIESVKKLSVDKRMIEERGKELKLVYTPLHGTGSMPVKRVLDEAGFKNVYIVKEQDIADPDFPTVSYPNPEDAAAFKLAIELGEETESDLIIATDPDCDRTGVAIRDEDGGYSLITGNQVGCLLMDYIIKSRIEAGKLPENSLVVKTIVTTPMAEEIGRQNGVSVINVLTGFKFIGEKIRELHDQGSNEYIFGFEESYGYLAGTDVRDKDGVSSSLLIAEMALYYKIQGITLKQALRLLYERYGYYYEGITSFTAEGIEGQDKIECAMSTFRRTCLEVRLSKRVTAMRDYLSGMRYDGNCTQGESISGLPASDVLYYELEDSAWCCIRPSGTEPKVKVYYGVKGNNASNAGKMLKELEESMLGLVRPLLS